MRSLFVQLCLAFLLVVVLTLGASMAGVYVSAVIRAAGLNTHVSPQLLARSAQQALSADGANGIVSWTISENHVLPELQIYFIDDKARDMLNRKVHG